MVVAWAAISVSRSSSLARDGILLSCLVEMVGGEVLVEVVVEVVVKVVVEVVVEVMGEIGKGGVKLFTVCCLSICFHQVPGTEKCFHQVPDTENMLSPSTWNRKNLSR